MAAGSDDEEPAIRKKARPRWRQIGCLLAGIIAAVVLFVGYQLHQVNETVLNSYAAWWVADMVVEHLKTNNDEWPTNWEELRDDYQTCVARSGDPWSFAELSQRVVIDWSADPQKLLAQSEGHETAAFRVISLADGSTAHWESHEPNQIILEYLRSTGESEPTRKDP